LQKIIHLFYNHYNKGFGRASAYESALWAVLTLGMVNALSAMLFFNFVLLRKYSYINGRDWQQNLLVMFITYFILGYHILWMLYKKEKLETLPCEASIIKRNGRWLVAYITVSLCVLLFTAVKYYRQ
jgi:hypothetical protein